MNKRLGSIFGYNVERRGTNYIFGCGEVKIPVTRVHNFVREFTARKKKPATAQERDYEAVVRIVRNRGRNVEDLTVTQLTKLFGKGEQPEPKKVVKKATPKKKK